MRYADLHCARDSHPGSISPGASMSCSPYGGGSLGMVGGRGTDSTRTGRGLRGLGGRARPRWHLSGRGRRRGPVDGGDRMRPFPDPAAHFHPCVCIPHVAGLPEATSSDGGLSVVWVPLLTAILANLHGGSSPCRPSWPRRAWACESRVPGTRPDSETRPGSSWRPSRRAWRRSLNPYGWDLYRHVGNLLVSSGVTSIINEYQSAPFGKPEARVLEMVLLAWSVCPPSLLVGWTAIIWSTS